MEDRILQLSKIEAKRPYIIKRIDEDGIRINGTERAGILQAMRNGVRFVELRNYIIMLNSIKSIDPGTSFTDVNMVLPELNELESKSFATPVTDDERRQARELLVIAKNTLNKTIQIDNKKI